MREFWTSKLPAFFNYHLSVEDGQDRETWQWTIGKNREHLGFKTWREEEVAAQDQGAWGEVWSPQSRREEKGNMKMMIKRLHPQKGTAKFLLRNSFAPSQGSNFHIQWSSINMELSCPIYYPVLKLYLNKKFFCYCFSGFCLVLLLLLGYLIFGCFALAFSVLYLALECLRGVFCSDDWLMSWLA